MSHILLALSLTATSAAAFNSRGALSAVLKTCEVSFKLSGGAFPCIKVVDGSNPLLSYAVLREPAEEQRTIFSPLADIPGIEDPRLLAPDAPNYFSMAWNERSSVIPASKDLWGNIGLAINASVYRTQDHLHIHIGCLRSEISNALRSAKVSSAEFRRLNVKLEGQTYWARFFPGDDMSNIDPVKQVADGVFLARRFMGGVTIGVAGAERDGARGFIILANTMGRKPDHFASTENFLDPKCGS